MYDLIALIPFAFVSGVTPGPNNIMLLSSVLNFGRKASYPHYFGITIGFPIMLFVVAMGMSQVFLLYPLLNKILEYIGAGYLLYLAAKISFAHNKLKTKKIKKPLSFFQAVCFQWVNPKAWMMSISTVSLFSDYPGNFLALTVIITIIFFIISCIATGIWLWFGDYLKKYLSNPKHLKIFNYCMGISLVITVVFMI